MFRLASPVSCPTSSNFRRDISPRRRSANASIRYILFWRKDRNNRGTHAARTTHITEMSRCKDKSHPSDDELTDAATDQDFGFSVTPLTAWRTLVPWATRRSVDAAAWQASTAKRGDNSLDRAKWGVKYASLSASLDSPPYHSMYFDSHQPTFLLSSSHNSWSPLLHYTCLPSP
jgi:hypothetical protein